MENEIKTLKDLGIKVTDQVNEEPVTHTKLVDSGELRNEAIKRFKYWVDLKHNQKEGQLINEMQIEGRLAELRDFFNITDEDLR